MGAITPVVSTLSSVVSAANTINSAVNIGRDWSGSTARDVRREQELAVEQLRARQKLADAKTISDTRTAQQTLVAETREAERKRQAALRRAVARQRASFGSNGISMEDGSSEAVLLGLVSESEAERVAREELDTIRQNALSQNAEHQQKQNLLELTQLAQRNALARAGRFG